jgi:hypothetical protein
MDEIEWEISREEENEDGVMEEELRQRQVAALGVLVYVGAKESRQL